MRLPLNTCFLSGIILLSLSLQRASGLLPMCITGHYLNQQLRSEWPQVIIHDIVLPPLQARDLFLFSIVHTKFAAADRSSLCFTFGTVKRFWKESLYPFRKKLPSTCLFSSLLYMGTGHDLFGGNDERASGMPLMKNWKTQRNSWWCFRSFDCFASRDYPAVLKTILLRNKLPSKPLFPKVHVTGWI